MRKHPQIANKRVQSLKNTNSQIFLADFSNVDNFHWSESEEWKLFSVKSENLLFPPPHHNLPIVQWLYASSPLGNWKLYFIRICHFLKQELFQMKIFGCHLFDSFTFNSYLGTSWNSLLQQQDVLHCHANSLCNHQPMLWNCCQHSFKALSSMHLSKAYHCAERLLRPNIVPCCA